MTEDQLRALVREAIAGHGPLEQQHGISAAEMWRAHASHEQLPLARGGDGDGACLIEPDVRCNHCGHCVSYGH